MTGTEPTCGAAHGDDYRALLRWAYEGEVHGAAFVDDLLTRQTFPAQAAVLRRLLRLESETRDVLRPLAMATGVEVDEEAPRRSGQAFAADTAQQAWSNFCETTEQIAIEALPTFRRLLAVGPTEVRAARARVVAHEEALLAFAQHSCAGRDEDALACLDEHVNAGQAEAGSCAPKARS